MRAWEWVRTRVLGLDPRPAYQFDSAPRPIDQQFLELRGRGASVSRAEALTVPAVLKARNRFCSLATLPLVEIDPANHKVDNPLLRQIDPNVPNVVTMAQTIEDLLFDAVAWWEVTARTFDGYPSSARRWDPSIVSIDPPAGHSPLPSGVDPRDSTGVWIDGRFVPARHVIRFDSPNPALRVAGARAIRKALKYDRAAVMYADNPQPLDYFSPADGADPISDDDARENISEWRAARKAGGTGWVPASMKYNAVTSPTAADMQLVELLTQCSLEIANACGLDPEVLGVSTTSRTYANAQDWRRDRINDVYAPYMGAITDRLSMGDVTRRGYRTRFELDEYMRANPTERWAVYAVGLTNKVIDPEEVRAAEGLPPGAPKPAAAPAPAPAPAPADDPAAGGDELARRRAAHGFAETPARRSFEFTRGSFSVDGATRTISGVAVPYNEIATKYGLRFRFKRGAIEFSDTARVKMLRDHDFTRPIGVATAINDRDGGLEAAFRIGAGADRDAVLQDAIDGIVDGLSVGVDFDDRPEAGDVVPDPDNDGVLLIQRATLREVSLTAMPAFDSARVTRVAANQGGTMHTCASCGAQLVPGQAHTCATAPVPAATPAPAPAAPAVAHLPTAALTHDQMTAAFNAMVTALGHSPVPLNQAPLAPIGAAPAVALPAGPSVVDPTGRAGLAFVREPQPYRFDRRGNLVGGSHHFGVDVISALKDGDTAAYGRVLEFVRAQFDVITTDVNELNPTPTRADMYVDQREYQYPVWNAIAKGTLTDITPFIFPKFSSSSGLVGAHTEGTEPSSGTLVTTSQTVTPAAISGKAKISREVWDQGGNPQVSNLIWTQMLRGWYEALEAAAVAVLDAATPTAIALTAGGGTDGQTLAAELTAALAALHFVRGGFSMDKGFTQIDLYKALIAAKDGDKRPLFPALGATNANGTVSNRFGAVDVNGVLFLPAWALAATGSVVASSYLFDSDVVHGWASTPQRLTIDQTEVANVYIGLWGYRATAISDVTGVREITYDPVA